MDETAILRKSEQQPFSGCHNAAPTAEGKEPGHPWAHSLLPSPRALGRVSTSLCPRACARFQTRTQSCHPALLQKESAQVMADGLLLSTYSHCSTGVLGSPSLLHLQQAQRPPTLLPWSQSPQSLLPSTNPRLQTKVQLTHTLPDILSNVQIVYWLPLSYFEGFLSKDAPKF